jgi:hypothetical protein
MLTTEEQAIITALEKTNGRRLTEAEIRLALEQARSVGELPQIDGKGTGYKVKG